MAHALTNHEDIQQWAQARGAKPAGVKGTGGKRDPGIIRLDLPGYSGEDSLKAISWDEWFRKFDEQDLALLVEDDSKQPSNFNKLVRRSTAEEKEGRSASPTPRRGGDESDDREARDDEDDDDFDDEDDFDDADDEDEEEETS
jgi:hypothetical protein